MKYGYFEHCRGGFSYYAQKEGDYLVSARFALGRFGEDPQRIAERFWMEWGDGDFEIVPLFSYGLPPRAALSTPESLTEALKTARIEPNSENERQWKETCLAHGVPWPEQTQNNTVSAAKDAA